MGTSWQLLQHCIKEENFTGDDYLHISNKLYNMAPPGYGDLGKQCSDLLSKGFHPGTVKFEAKTKAQNGMKFTTTGQNNTDNGKMLGGAELNVEWPDYGLKYNEKWNTDNQL